MSTILSIKEESFTEGKYHYYDGFVIALSDGESVKLGISNEQNCCEQWGYFMSNDEIESFIGAELLDVKTVDNCLNKEKCPEMYEGGITFIDIETSKGVLQFTAYNEHNGYYGHAVVVIRAGKQIMNEDV